MTIEVTLLGTGSPLPSPDRAGPATLVRPGGATLLVDCGRGVVMRLAAAGRAAHRAVGGAAHPPPQRPHHRPQRRRHHPLGDGTAPGAAAGRRPAGHPAVVDGLLAMLGPDQQYRLDHHDDLDERPVGGGHRGGAGRHVRRSAGATVVGARDRPPAGGADRRLPGRARRARSAALAGDTVPCAGLDELCAGADLYVQTVIREDLVRAVPSARLQDILDYHSTVEQAAQTAARGRRAHPRAHPLRAARWPARRRGGVAGPGGRPLRRRDRPRRRPDHRHRRLTAPVPARDR